MLFNGFNIFTDNLMISQISPQSNFRTFSSLLKKPHTHSQLYPTTPSPQLLGTSVLYGFAYSVMF